MPPSFVFGHWRAIASARVLRLETTAGSVVNAYSASRQVGLSIRPERLREHYSAQSLTWYGGPFDQDPFLRLPTGRGGRMVNLTVAPTTLDRQRRSVAWINITTPTPRFQDGVA